MWTPSPHSGLLVGPTEGPSLELFALLSTTKFVNTRNIRTMLDNYTLSTVTSGGMRLEHTVLQMAVVAYNSALSFKTVTRAPKQYSYKTHTKTGILKHSYIRLKI